MDIETEISFNSTFNSSGLFTARDEGTPASTSSSVKSRNRGGRCDAYSRKPLGDEPIRDANGRKLHYCALCEPNENSYSSIVSSNLAVHLKSKHDVDVHAPTPATRATAASQLSVLWRQAQGTAVANSHTADILRSVINEEVVNRALVTLVASRSLPFRIVEWPEFHTFCMTLNPESKITISRAPVAVSLSDMYYSQMDIVRRRVQSAISDIHLAVDIWTSPNGYLFLAVCCYFVTKEGNRLKCLLALREVGGHSGEEQWTVLLQVLDEYGIIQKIGTITGDNSSTNDTLCRAASEYLNEHLGIMWNPEEQRIRCQGHTINLVAKAFLFNKAQQSSLESKELGEEDREDPDNEDDEDNEDRANTNTKMTKEEALRQMGLLGRLHNIVINTRTNPGRRKQFQSLAGRMIPVDNATRWNSWYRMISTALSVESHIDSFIKANLHIKPLETNALTPREWQDLRTISYILEPFYQATMDTQGDKATLDQTLISMDILNEHLKRCAVKHKTNKELLRRMNRAIRKLKKYYAKIELSPLYFAAVVFQPNLRSKYITLTRKRDHARTLLAKVEELWVKHRDSSTLPEPVPYETPESPGTKKADNVYYDIRRELVESIARPRSQDEYKDYCSETPYEIDISPIAWWSDRVQQKRFPRLSALAINILSIPAMSDEPERVFSGGRYTIPHERSSLGVISIERLECMKVWHRSGILLKDGMPFEETSNIKTLNPDNITE